MFAATVSSELAAAALLSGPAGFLFLLPALACEGGRPAPDSPRRSQVCFPYGFSGGGLEMKQWDAGSRTVFRF